MQTPYERLPTWLLKLDWDMEIRYFNNIFPNICWDELKDFWRKKQYVSSPERAFYGMSPIIANALFVDGFVLSYGNADNLATRAITGIIGKLYITES